MATQLLPIGRVVKTHGIKGRIKAAYYGKDPRLFSLYPNIFIESEHGQPVSYEVSEAIPKPPHLILRLKGMEKIEEAEALIGKTILIEKEMLQPLEAGEYYWTDLIGMKVATREGKEIGIVKEILSAGGSDVFVIQGRHREILLPVIEAVVQSIDLDGKIIRVIRMEGLWEDEDEV